MLKAFNHKKMIMICEKDLASDSIIKNRVNELQ